MEAAFRAWWQESYGLPPGPHAVMTHVAWGEHLLATRPKAPSLKEQALEALGPDPLPETGPTKDTILNMSSIERHRTIRRAIEALPND